MSKKDLLKAKREKGLVGITDIIQNEIRNEGKIVDIRALRVPRLKKGGRK